MQDDPKKRKPDITRAKKYLNWSPQVCSDLFSGETFSVCSLNPLLHRLYSDHDIIIYF